MTAKKQGAEVHTATDSETTAETQASPSAETMATDASETERVPDNGSQPATTFDPSGAPEQIVSDVDPSHPAVDNDPRASTTAEQNRIDFNDPTISGPEAVQRNLDAQAKA